MTECKTCMDDDRDASHPVQGRRSRCAACGYKSHHFAATVVKVAGEYWASPSYCGAADPMGNVGPSMLCEPWPEGATVAVSWCCGAPKRTR